MLFYTHLLLGIVFFLVTRGFWPAISTPVFFVILLLGSLLPDLDEPHSRINRWSGIIGRITAFLTRHRGFFHSLFFIAIVAGIVIYFWNWYYGLALALGYVAHLVGDMLTPAGVALFYPFSSFKLRGPIRTGSVWEKVFMAVLIAVIVLKLL